MNDLRARVLRDTAASPSPTRKNQRLRTLAVTATFVGSVLLAALSGHRGERSSTYLAVALFGHALAVVASTWWIAAPGGALGRSRPLVRLSAAAATVVLVLGVLLAAGIAPQSAAPMHTACTSMDLALGAVFFFGAAFGLRPFDPVAPRSTAIGLGVLGMAWGALAMALHCPIGSAHHVLASHVFPGLAFVLLGAVVGRRWFGPRPV